MVLGHFRATRVALLTVTALSLIISQPIAAQVAEARSSTPENEPDDAQIDAETGGLTDIVVTARKREESLQDVPTSVVAVGKAQLENYSVGKIDELANKLPNFVVPAGIPTSLTDVSVRGINTAVRNAGFTPSISFYLDGYYQGRPANFNQMLFDIGRVELLLGPQGTLFGNNTIAGVVNIVTEEPTNDSYGRARIGVGNYDLRQLEVIGNAALSPVLSARLSSLIQRRNGFQDNLNTGLSHGNLDRGALRLQLKYDSGATSALLRLGYQEGHERPPVLEYVAPGASLFPADPPFENDFERAPRPFAVAQDPSTTSFVREDVSLTINHELTPDLTLVSLTGYKHSDTEDIFDNDFAADARLRADVRNREAQKLFSQEIRLESDPSKRLSFVAGGYYLSDQVELVKSFDYRAPFIILGPMGELGLAIDSLSQVDTKGFAAFGNIEYDIWDNLEISAGLRYSKEKMKAAYDQAEVFRSLGLPTDQVLPLGPGGGILIANASRYEDERSDELWSWTTTLTYHIDDEKMVYGRYARGTKSGGFNLEPLPAPVPADRSFDKETLDNYELGFKTQWFNRRFRFNITAFLQRYHDLQRADLIPIEIAPGVMGATRVIRNAAEVESKGVELSAELLPIDGLRLYGTYGFAKAKFVEYTINSGEDLSGQALTGVPKWNAAAGIDYSFFAGNSLRISPGLAAEFRGSRELGLADAVAVGVEGYTILNAHLTIEPDTRNWTLNLWANNLADKLYVTSRGAATDFYRADVVGFGMPRTFGATLAVNF